jgi:hypothetical protein
MLHIVFQHADVATLQKAIELDDSLQGDILEIKDDFAVGPIENIDMEEGWAARENWWRGLLSQSPYSNESLVGSFDDQKTVEVLKRRLDEDHEEVAWLWMGQNGHDVCGYYWLISQLKEYQGKIFVLYFNNLPFINEKGNIFYPTTLHEIQPKEFLKAKKLNRAVTLSEFEVDPDEWKKLASENALVRILEGGKKIVSKDADFYDKDILANLGNEFQKGNRAISNILGKMKIKTGDVFLIWRMKQLAAQDKLEINGDTSKSWKDFEVRLKTNAPLEEVVPTSTEVQ